MTDEQRRARNQRRRARMSTARKLTALRRTPAIDPSVFKDKVTDSVVLSSGRKPTRGMPRKATRLARERGAF